MYDTADDEDYDKTRRISLTQAYRRTNDIRQPIGNRRIGINNGNHPIYKVIFHLKESCQSIVSFRMMIIIINNNLVQQQIVFQQQQQMPLLLILVIHLLQKSMMPN